MTSEQRAKLDEIRDNMARGQCCECYKLECKKCNGQTINNGYHKYKAGWDAAITRLEPLIEALEKCKRRLEFIEDHSCNNPERAGYENGLSIKAAREALTKVFGETNVNTDTKGVSNDKR